MQSRPPQPILASRVCCGRRHPKTTQFRKNSFLAPIVRCSCAQPPTSAGAVSKPLREIGQKFGLVGDWPRRAERPPPKRSSRPATAAMTYIPYHTLDEAEDFRDPGRGSRRGQGTHARAQARAGSGVMQAIVLLIHRIIIFNNEPAVRVVMHDTKVQRSISYCGVGRLIMVYSTRAPRRVL